MLPASPCAAEFYEIWHTRSTQRHNHMCQIFSQSVQGLRSSDTPKIAISHWLTASPLQQCTHCRATLWWIIQMKLCTRTKCYKINFKHRWVISKISQWALVLYFGAPCFYDWLLTIWPNMRRKMEDIQYLSCGEMDWWRNSDSADWTCVCITNPCGETTYFPTRSSSTHELVTP